MTVSLQPNSRKIQHKVYTRPAPPSMHHPTIAQFYSQYYPSAKISIHEQLSSFGFRTLKNIAHFAVKIRPAEFWDSSLEVLFSLTRSFSPNRKPWRSMYSAINLHVLQIDATNGTHQSAFKLINKLSSSVLSAHLAVITLPIQLYSWRIAPLSQQIREDPPYPIYTTLKRRLRFLRNDKAFT